jgi:hypothetical protein
MTTVEQERFIRYQEIYDEKALDPEEVVIPGQQPQLPSVPQGAATATKTMNTRRNTYGKEGLSQEGRRNIQNAPRKQG